MHTKRLIASFGDRLLKDINPALVEAHYFRIMAASGHKTMSVFKRYNTVSKKELQALVNGNSG